MRIESVFVINLFLFCLVKFWSVIVIEGVGMLSLSFGKLHEYRYFVIYKNYA